MYCLVIGGNYVSITARPSKREGEKKRRWGRRWERKKGR